MLIFDLDGTLIDSNGVWVEVDKIFLSRRGFPYTKEYYEGVAHTSLQNCATFTKAFLGLEESCEAIIAEWMDLTQDAYDHIPLKPYAREYLERCRQAGHRMCLLTACVPEHCMAALRAHGLEPHFEKILMTQELGIDKKSPEAFRKAAEILGVSPRECVLFDDSLSACKSAKAAGMTVVGVADDFFQDSRPDMQELCDRYISGFGELL